MINDLNKSFSKVVSNYHEVVKPTLLKQNGLAGIQEWFTHLATNLLASKGLFPKDFSYVQAIAKELGKKYGENNLFTHQVLPAISLDELKVI